MLDPNNLLGFPLKSWTPSILIVETGDGHGSTGSRIRRFSNLRESKGRAVTWVRDAVFGDSFVINERGMYLIQYQDSWSAGAAVIGVSLNTTSLSTAISSISWEQGGRGHTWTQGNAAASSVTVPLFLIPGDIIRAHTNGDPNSTGMNTQFKIIQLFRA